MTETVIKQEDVVWDMEWDQTAFPDKPKVEQIFDQNLAMAVLLAEEVIFLSTQWWKKELSEEQKKLICCSVNLDSVFAWGGSAAIELELTELEPLYHLWKKDKFFGVVRWACKKYNLQPQYAIIRDMKAANLWDDEMESLKINTSK